MMVTCILFFPGGSSLCTRKWIAFYGDICKNCHECQRYIPCDRYEACVMLKITAKQQFEDRTLQLFSLTPSFRFDQFSADNFIVACRVGFIESCLFMLERCIISYYLLILLSSRKFLPMSRFKY